MTVTGKAIGGIHRIIMRTGAVIATVLFVVLVPLAFRDRGEYLLRALFFVPLFLLLGFMVYQGVIAQFATITVSVESLVYRSPFKRIEIRWEAIRNLRTVVIKAGLYFVVSTTDRPKEVWIPGGDAKVRKAILTITTEQRIRGRLAEIHSERA